jgi:hypothetical protein
MTGTIGVRARVEAIFSWFRLQSGKTFWKGRKRWNIPGFIERENTPEVIKRENTPEVIKRQNTPARRPELLFVSGTSM